MPERYSNPSPSISVFVFAIVAALSFYANVSLAAVVFEEQTLLTSGEGGYNTYRIPSAIRTDGDNVLFFCEARKTSSSDFAETHMLMLRSSDGGQNWSEPQIVWQDNSASEVTIGNPCPVYDSQTNTVWLGFTRDNLTVFTTKSTDGGQTWSETPTEITADVCPSNWTRYWTGPGHGLQLSQGDNAGRLLFPSYHIVDEGDRNVMRSHMVYSDDHGATWQVGQSTEVGPTIDPSGIHMPPASWIPAGYDWEGCEALAVETVDGRLYMTIRNQPGYEGKKAYAISNDGGTTWQPMALADDLPGVTCQSSVIRLADAAGGGTNQILWSGITSASGGRHGMTVFLSENEAASFPQSKLVYNGPSAYSDMAVLDDQTTLLFYEAGTSSAYETIRMARFNTEWLEQPNPPNTMANGNFEDTTGWGDAGTTDFPPGWTASGGRTSAASPQSDSAAIGGAGTSAFMPAAPGENRDLAQSFPKFGPQWRFDMDFAAEEPDGQGSDNRTLSLGWTTDEGQRFYMIITGNGNEGAAADGLGDVQIYNPASGYFTPTGLEDAVIFDDNVQDTPLVHHLRIEGDFTADVPFYDIYVTDSNGTVHSVMGITLFNGGTPSDTAGLVRFTDNTFLSTGDHLLDNIGIIDLPLPSLPGDANGDGRVNHADAALLASNWQTQTGATWADGDFNDDGRVDDADATILAANWQVGVEPSQSVPEPAGLVMVASAFGMVWLVRWAVASM